MTKPKQSDCDRVTGYVPKDQCEALKLLLVKRKQSMSGWVREQVERELDGGLGPFSFVAPPTCSHCGSEWSYEIEGISDTACMLRLWCTGCEARGRALGLAQDEIDKSNGPPRVVGEYNGVSVVCYTREQLHTLAEKVRET